MPYSVELLDTVAECDAVLSKFELEKEDLEFRKTQVARLKKSYKINSTEIAAELIAVNAEITSLTAMVATLPEGERKEKAITELERAKLNKRVLTTRQQGFGSVALLERELELNMAESQLANVTAAITEVAARKAAL
jgi:hypothetical protein